MRNPDSANQAIPKLILKYASTFRSINADLMFYELDAESIKEFDDVYLLAKYRRPLHIKEVNSIIKAVENLVTILENEACTLTDFYSTQQRLDKIDFDLAVLITLKKIFSGHNLELDQLNGMFSLWLTLRKYLHTRKGEHRWIDINIQSLSETIDAFSKECSDEVQKIILSNMKNDCWLNTGRRISYTPFTLQPMTQAQRDAVFFGVAGGAGVVLASGLFRHASASVGPAIRNTLRNFFKR